MAQKGRLSGEQPVDWGRYLHLDQEEVDWSKYLDLGEPKVDESALDRAIESETFQQRALSTELGRAAEDVPPAKPAPPKEPEPYKDVREAAEDALNLIEEGADRREVAKKFMAAGLPQEELAKAARRRGYQWAEVKPSEPDIIPQRPSGEMRAPDQPGLLGELSTAAQRGYALLRQDFANAVRDTLGVDNAAELARWNRRAQALAPSEQVQRDIEQLSEASWLEVVPELLSRPRTLLTLLAESFSRSSPILATGLIGGGVGVAAGLGRFGTAVARGAGAAPSALALGYGAGISEFAADNGIDLGDVRQVEALFADKEKLSEAREYALKYGVPVAAFDTLSMGLAGVFTNPLVRRALSGDKVRVREVLAASAKEAGLQGAAGGLGEIAGSLNVGKEINPFEVAIEVLAEVVSAAPEAGVSAATTPRRSIEIARIKEAESVNKLVSDIVNAKSVEEAISIAERGMAAPNSMSSVVDELLARRSDADRLRAAGVPDDVIDTLVRRLREPATAQQAVEPPAQQVAEPTAQQAEERPDISPEEAARRLEEASRFAEKRQEPTLGPPEQKFPETVEEQAERARRIRPRVRLVDVGGRDSTASAYVNGELKPVSDVDIVAEDGRPFQTREAAERVAATDAFGLNLEPVAVGRGESGWEYVLRREMPAPREMAARRRSEPDEQSVRRLEEAAKGLGQPEKAVVVDQPEVAELERALKASGRDISLMAVDISVFPKNRKAEASLAALMAEAVGAPLTFVKASDPRAFNGLYHKGRLFLSIDAPTALPAVAGHEFLHRLKATAPDLYDKLARATIGILKPQKTWYEKYDLQPGSFRESAVTEEMLADLSGDAWLDPGFWRQVAAEVDGGTFVKLKARFLALLDRMLRVLTGKGYGSADFTSDLRKARSEIAKVTSAYIRREGRGMPADEPVVASAQEPALSRTKNTEETPEKMLPARNRRLLTEEERNEMTRNDARVILETWSELPPTKELAAVALAGAAKRGWYKRAAGALFAAFGFDAPRFAALLAALSPQISVEGNLMNALKTWANWVAEGRPTSAKEIRDILARSVEGTGTEKSLLEAWVNNSIEALTTNDPVNLRLSGPKVSSFHRNLMNVTNEVTNDAWVSLFFGIEQKLLGGKYRVIQDGRKKGFKGGHYLALSMRTREAAELITEMTGEKWTPQEVQETIWSWTKAIVEMRKAAGETRSIVQLAKDGVVTDDIISSMPEFASLLTKEEYANVLRQAGIDPSVVEAEQAKNQPAAVGETVKALRRSQTFLLKRAAERIERTLAARGDEPLLSRLPPQPPVGERFKIDAETRAQNLRRHLQDDLLRLRNVQSAVEKQGGKLTEESNAYLVAERMPGRIMDQVERFDQEELSPLLGTLVENDIGLDEFALYAYARHAPERNEYISSINEKIGPAGSGMSNEAAAEIVRDVEASGKKEAFERAHRMLMDIQAKTRRIMLDAGLITIEEYEALNKYKNYVPLRGFEDSLDESGKHVVARGKGFSIQGKETLRAKGRRSRAGNLIENVVLDRTRTINRAERNAVAKTFLDFVMDNPDPGLWEVNAIVQKPRIVRTGEGINVVYDPKPDAGDNVVVAKVAGVEMRITLRDAALAESMNKLGGTDSLGPVMDFMATFNRWLARGLTGMNPTFVVINAFRDFQTAMFQGLRYGKGISFGIAKDWAPAVLAGIRKSYRGSSLERSLRVGDWKKWDRLLDDFSRNGGRTGFMALRTLADVNVKLQNDLALARAGNVQAGRRVLAHMLRFAELIEGVNNGVEIGARLAAYDAALKSGMSKAEAISVGKNITINFNRRGQSLHFIQPFFLFMNPAIQGAHILFKSLTNPKVRLLAAALFGGAIGIAMMGLQIGGEDDDGIAYWDKIPDYIKDRNLVFMLPPGEYTLKGVDEVARRGRYIKIPLPYGINFFNSLGHAVFDGLRNAADPTTGRSKARIFAALVESAAMSWNPLGGESPLTQFAPALQPFMQHGLNYNRFGDQLYPETRDGDSSPPSERFFEFQRGTFSHFLARLINSATGGDEFERGLISIPPPVIYNYITYFTAGPGMFIDNAIASPLTQAITKGDVSIEQLPFVRQVYGTVDARESRRMFREKSAEAKQALDRVKKKMAADVEPSETEELLAAAGIAAQKFDQALGKLKSYELAVKTDKELSREDRIRELNTIELQRRQLYSDWLRIWKDAHESR